jgi:hypothetical protein
METIMNYQLTLIISSLLIVSGCGWGNKETSEHKHNPHKINSEKKHHGERVKTQAAEPQFNRQEMRRKFLEKCKEKGKTADCEKLMKESTTKSETVKTQLFRNDKDETRILGREKKHRTRRALTGE